MRHPLPKPDRTQGGAWLAPQVPVRGERGRVYLLPGDLHVSVEPSQITTILGSCVSICLWDKRRGIGGMNHFVLPLAHQDKPTSSRFADVATGLLLEQLLALGSKPYDLIAKIFGGAAILWNQQYATSLGAKNVAAALSLLEEAGISIAVQETGGSQGRKVVFNTDDGATWSRQV